MQFKSLSIASLLLVVSTSSFASYIKILNDEEQSTYHLSKYCVGELNYLKNESPDAWIGQSEYLEYHNGTYGFNYRVYHAPNYFETKELAVISLTASPVPPPVPADAPSHTFNCKFTRSY
ncbi:hypothetical protein F0225_05645 [Vibrio pectenicida]|uniref:Secreted effector protein n=1 Tax=Vibrio pectenicida TaxID=62763 RepID=A0A7Y3ZXB1_9VIBR|nr:hypothetical protein [Vibrio pectenicida]NOH70826.1 hypothetical protein [Vibrio pectenicida]